MIEIIPNWHPVFVHFTVALFTMAAVLYCYLYITDRFNIKSELLIVANWFLWFGAAFTVGTVLTGIYAYNTVSHDDVSHAVMQDHINWAIVTALIFTGLAIKLYLEFRKNKNVSVSKKIVLVVTIGLGLLMTTAWKGGEMVYRHGMGVMSLPKTDTEFHDHSSHDHGVGSNANQDYEESISKKISVKPKFSNTHENGSHIHAHSSDNHIH